MIKRMIIYWICIISGYFSGSILFGYEVPRVLKRVDVCEISADGNPGTYNAFKYGGFMCGVITLLAELLKGSIPVYLCRKYLGMNCVLFSAVMAAPVFGHAFSVFHHGKGGKAIAVSFGVMIGLTPQMRPLLILILSYLIFSLILPIRDHGKRSIATFACFAVMSMTFIRMKYIVLGNIMISCIVVYKHVISNRGDC